MPALIALILLAFAHGEVSSSRQHSTPAATAAFDPGIESQDGRAKLQRARQARAAGDVGRSRELLHEILKQLQTQVRVDRRAAQLHVDAAKDWLELCPTRDEAQVVGERAIAAAESSGDRLLPAFGRLNLATWHSNRGESQAARKLVESGLENLPSSAKGDFLRVLLLQLLADVEADQGNYGSALESLERAESALGRCPCALRVRQLSTLHRVQLGMGLPDLALRTAEEELAQAVTCEDYPIGPLLARSDRVGALLAVGDWSEARVAGRALLADPDLARVPQLERQVRLQAGCAAWELFLHGGLADDSEARAKFLGLVGDMAASAATRQTARLWLADVHLTSGEVEAARARLDEVQEHIDSSQRSRAARLEERTTLATLRVELALSAEVTGGELSAARAELAATWDEALASWATIPHREGGVGYLHYGRRRRALGALMTASQASSTGSDSSSSELELLYEAQRLGSAARFGWAEGTDLAGALGALQSEGSGLLALFPFRRTCHVFVSTDGRPDYFRVSVPPDLKQLASRFTVDVMTEPTSRSSEAGASLAKHLFTPELRWRLEGLDSVHLLGAEFFNGLPFELLPWDEELEFGQRFAVTRVPSLPVAERLASRSSSNTDGSELIDLLLFAAPRPNEAQEKRWPELQRLEFNERLEAELLAGSHELRTQVVSAQRATAGELRRALARGVGYLHLLAHGVLDPEFGSSAGLLLASDDPQVSGWMPPSSWNGLEVPPLVLLSACHGGAASVRFGEEGAAGLAGALLQNGARTVVLSPFELDYSAQRFAAAEFQKALFIEGCSAAEALRRTRMALGAHSRWGAPRHRALQAVGLGTRP